MKKIQDYNSYTSKMRKPIADKCWWLDKISDSIDTIIDFGCADASVIEYISDLLPDRFRFFGVENDVFMQQKAREKMGNKKNFYLVSDINAIPIEKINPDRTIIVMNSVIHEIYSYLSDDEQCELFSAIKNINAKYIAIRDMHSLDSSNIGSVPDPQEICTRISTSDHKTAFNEYVRLEQHPDSSPDFIAEFLLKYFYKENWEREKQEQYLWDWKSCFLPLFESTGYNLGYAEDFTIQFLVERWKDDFGVALNCPTHSKVLLVR